MAEDKTTSGEQTSQDQKTKQKPAKEPKPEVEAHADSQTYHVTESGNAIPDHKAALELNEANKDTKTG